MQDFQIKLNELKLNLKDKQKSFLSLKSIENFLIYYDRLRRFKTEVYNLLAEYFSLIQKENYIIDKKKAREIGSSYIMQIGIYYRIEANFKFYRPLTSGFFWGIQVDIILLLFGILKKIFYVPIATLLLILNWAYVKIFFEAKGKVFGIMY
jgi:hypothetical protein